MTAWFCLLQYFPSKRLKNFSKGYIKMKSSALYLQFSNFYALLLPFLRNETEPKWFYTVLVKFVETRLIKMGKVCWNESAFCGMPGVTISYIYSKKLWQFVFSGTFGWGQEIHLFVADRVIDLKLAWIGLIIL